MIKVLVTGAGAVLGQGIINALRRSTIEAEIVAADPHPLAAGLFWADSAYVIPMANDPRYMERIGEILEAERPQLVLVGTDIELPLFAEHRHSLEERYQTHVLVSDPKVVSIADDKYLTFEFLEKEGLNPPRSALPEDEAQLQKLMERVGFPLVVKPRIGARSAGMSVVNDKQALDEALRGRSGLVVQECVGDDESEYTASVLVFDGKADASIVMRRDLRDGNTHRAYTENFEELNAQVRQWGMALQPYGPANFQFRTDAQGRPRVFEINGRFSGTTPLRALVGFNEVEMCARHILFGEPIRQPAVEQAIVVRHLSETLVRTADMEKLK